MSHRSTAATEADVVIVGYGPVGQVLAAHLGAYGHRVVVLERHDDLYGLPRAGHFDHEIMRVFRRLGIGTDVAAIAIPALAYQFRDSSGDLIAELTRPDEAPSGGPWSYHFYQPDLERILDRRVRCEASVDVRTGWEVESVELEPRPAVHARQRSTGRREVFAASYVIGADGANSVVREQLGIESLDLGFHADWLVVDVELDDYRGLEHLAATNQILDAARPGYIGRLDDRRARWEFMVLDHDNPSTIASEASVRQLLRRWLPGNEGRIIRSVVYTFESVLARPWRTGRALLAGDAAHRMPPFLGQGMCSGIRDATTLSWMLDLVLRDRADTQLLDAYEPTRSHHVRSFIDASVEVGRSVSVTDPAEVQRLTRQWREAPPAPPPWSPPAGPPLVRADDPLAGTLAPEPGTDARRRRLGDHPSALPGFQVVSRADGIADRLPTRTRFTAERLGMEIVDLAPADVGEPSDATNRTIKWLDDAGVDAVLVRPDFYVVGSACGADDVGALIDHAGEVVAVR